jgi:TRAP-type C4-dicarboxylate transport system permease small subunit
VTGAKPARTAFDPLRKPLDVALALAVLAPTIAVFVQVIYRYVLNDPTSWLDEFATLCFAWMTLLGAAVVQCNDAHMSIEVFAVRMPRALQVALFWLRNALVAVLLVMLFWLGLDLTLRMSFIEYSAMGISRGFLFATLPVCAPLMLWYLVRGTLASRRRIRDGGPVFPAHEAPPE